MLFFEDRIKLCFKNKSGSLITCITIPSKSFTSFKFDNEYAKYKFGGERLAILQFDSENFFTALKK
jgi:hypothetical protein